MREMPLRCVIRLWDTYLVSAFYSIVGLVAVFKRLLNKEVQLLLTTPRDACGSVEWFV